MYPPTVHPVLPQEEIHLVGQGLLPHVRPLYILVGLERSGVGPLFGPEVKQSPVLLQQLPSGLPAEGQIV